MINISNYLDISRNIDFNKLPAALQNGDKLTKGAASNNWSAYNANDNIKRVVDIYIQKLDEFMQKNPQFKSETQPKTTALVKVDKTASPKKSAKVRTAKAKTVKAKKEKTAKVKKVKETKKQPEPVEKVLPEINFIKRYIGLHEKEKTQSEILRFISALQKAILEKRIRKTSTYATEIENIQNQLIKCYEKMGDTIKINIDKNTFEKYKEIAYSQKAMLSVTYIKQYINLHGKKNVKEKAEELMAKLQKAVQKNKINKTDPYADRLTKMYNSLNQYIEGKTTTPEISKSELNGLMGLAGYSQKKSPDLKGFDDDNDEYSVDTEVIPSIELAGMEFETIGLKGKYHELIGDPCVGFSAMVYGLPKSGKSTLCIDFAKYLAEHHGKVLYVAIEEGFGYTLKEKLERLRAIHPNIYVSENIPEDLSKYEYVFIDSVSRAKLTIEDLNNLRKSNPEIAFIFVFHTTKNGQFKGQNQFAHDVDVIIEVANGKAKGNGRFGWGEVEVWN